MLDVRKQVRDAQTIEELPTGMDAYRTASAASEAIAACSLDKLKYILQTNSLEEGDFHINTDHYGITLHLLRNMLDNKFNSSKMESILETTKFLVENYDFKIRDYDLIYMSENAIPILHEILELIESKPSSLVPEHDSVNYAARIGIYGIAGYLLDKGSKITPLSLGDVFLNGKHLFKSFNWLVVHGATFKENFLGTATCYLEMGYADRFTEHAQAFALNDALKRNLTTKDTILEIYHNCNVYAQLMKGEITKEETCYQSNLSVANIEFLLKKGISLFPIYTARALMNTEDAAITKRILDQMPKIDYDISDYQDGNVKLMNISQENCDSNKIIADYLNLTGDSRLDWSQCE